jgi:hypothetical protein
MSLFRKYLEGIDLFSTRPVWYVRGKEKQGSLFGTWWSILFVGYGIWATVYLSGDLINKTNPQTSQTLLSGAAINDPFIVGENRFEYVFGIGINDLSNSSINYYSWDQTLFKIDVTIGNEMMTLVPCNVTDIRSTIPYLGELLCLPRGREFTLQGSAGGIIVTIGGCENSTENNNMCQSPEAIQTAVPSVWCDIFYKLVNVDPLNYTTPVTQFWAYKSFSPVAGYSKYISTIFRRADLLTDDGWLMQSDKV